MSLEARQDHAAVASGARDTRRRHSDALKRELVERSLQPGASVAALAQEHGINANLLFTTCL